MDDATKKAMSEFVQQALAAAKAGAQWSADQAPLLVQEWLRWQLAFSVFFGVVGLVLVVGGIVSAVKARRACVADAAESRYHDAGGYVVWGVFGGALPIVFGVMVFLSNSANALKVFVAPRVAVLEKLSELIK